jgi:hypothetical protein
VANLQRPRAGMGVSITYSSKFGMQFNYDRRHCGPRSRFVQSYQKIFNGEGFGNSQEGSSKFVKTLDSGLGEFHWQDGYGLFSVSPSHCESVRKYILDQEGHHRKETFQEEYLRILKKYGAPYDERYLWD